MTSLVTTQDIPKKKIHYSAWGHPQFFWHICDAPIIFCHFVTCCVPSSVTETVLNCVVPNGGNNHWQPQTSLFSSGQQLSPLPKCPCQMSKAAAARRVGGGGGYQKSRIAAPPLPPQQQQQRSWHGCCTPDTREDRGRLSRITYHHRQRFARRKIVPEIADKLRTDTCCQSKGKDNTDRD